MKGVTRNWKAGLGLAAILVAGCHDFDASERLRTADLTDTAWAISYLTGTLLGERIGNREAGPQDVRVACSRGGTIRMTGQTAYDAGTAVLDLDITYTFSNAHASVVASNLVVTFQPLTGTIRQTGAMRLGPGTAYEDHAAVSTGLVFDVTIERVPGGLSGLTGEGPCECETRTWTNSVGGLYRRLSGELDGAAFSWDYVISATNAWTNVTGVVVIL